MRDDMRLVRLWQIRATDAAILFCTMPPGDGGQEVWIPRSLMGHVSRDPVLPCGWRPCNVEVAEWKLKAIGL